MCGVCEMYMYMASCYCYNVRISKSMSHANKKRKEGDNLGPLIKQRVCRKKDHLECNNDTSNIMLI